MAAGNGVRAARQRGLREHSPLPLRPERARTRDRQRWAKRSGGSSPGIFKGLGPRAVPRPAEIVPSSFGLSRPSALAAGLGGSPAVVPTQAQGRPRSWRASRARWSTRAARPPTNRSTPWKPAASAMAVPTSQPGTRTTTTSARTSPLAEGLRRAGPQAGHRIGASGLLSIQPGHITQVRAYAARTQSRTLPISEARDPNLGWTSDVLHTEPEGSWVRLDECNELLRARAAAGAPNRVYGSFDRFLGLGSVPRKRRGLQRAASPRARLLRFGRSGVSLGSRK